MAEKRIPISISVSVLEEYFQCSICLNVMQCTVVTSCGHRYCDKCIREWVDRHQSCPCCNRNLSIAQLIKDHQYDGLIDACKQQREAAESIYFEKIINTATDPDMSPGTSNTPVTTNTPVEQVLKKHLKSSLAAHELYFEDLRRQFEAKTHWLELTMRKDLERLQLDGLTPAALNQKILELEKRLAEKKSSLQADVEQCQELVAEAFDRYLTAHIPSLDILPVKVNVVLAGKNITIPDVTLRPDDVLTVIQTAVEEGLIQRGDRVIRWQHDGGKVLLVSPLSKQERYNVEDIIQDINSGGDNYPGIQILPWVSKPVLQCHMKPGSDLVLNNSVVCESDLPKICYAQQHKEQGPSTVDYFTCKQCNFKWICRSCIQVCHKDHDIAPLVFSHKPTWACCYCPKKKTCHLLQAR
ncbi:uncharacterized protein LOC143296922 [Babylonia areolata]|uniref:uncharacterized protein LOC143296922 n=1 Tax=Babylonia areolata TaxID=304850 RepID=UPI003FD652CE